MAEQLTNTDIASTTILAGVILLKIAEQQLSPTVSFLSKLSHLSQLLPADSLERRA